MGGSDRSVEQALLGHLCTATRSTNGLIPFAACILVKHFTVHWHRWWILTNMCSFKPDTALGSTAKEMYPYLRHIIPSSVFYNIDHLAIIKLDNHSLKFCLFRTFQLPASLLLFSDILRDQFLSLPPRPCSHPRPAPSTRSFRRKLFVGIGRKKFFERSR